MDTKKLFRSRQDKMVGGVCGGLAKYFAMDPTVMRLIFVLLAMFGGPGLILYIVLWIITPVEP